MSIPTSTPPKFNKPQAWIRLEEAWNENPLMVIAVLGVSAKGFASLINAVSGIASKRAYARLHGK